MPECVSIMMRILWLTGIGAAFLLLVALIWSIIFPTRRLWPPDKSSTTKKIVVWLHTLLIFGCAIFLGIADWNSLEWPSIFRWGFGLPLIVTGNVIVWVGVAQLGMEATSGEATELQVDGLYRYSRNPQYVADVAILLGWLILSASEWAFPVALLGIATLIVAPFAEERWLVDVYGTEYAAYRTKVRRYL